MNGGTHNVVGMCRNQQGIKSKNPVHKPFLNCTSLPDNRT
ncbi:hypothetical protein SLEP1_g57280 [Rubroshorea leprosula]|uniref:Uncharacterized protein n=1 Tax=Rubroshorea leprosula TaxID=152421 RepID=A0AAV5MQA1_9ROSI|nr:hypothetical protein SLEP1_g57280 [Rubroshorea leprosula]